MLDGRGVAVAVRVIAAMAARAGAVRDAATVGVALGRRVAEGTRVRVSVRVGSRVGDDEGVQVAGITVGVSEGSGT